MKITLPGGLELAALIIGALIAAALVFVALRNRAKWMPPLEELVTLDSRGWRLVAMIASAGAVIMITTSQLFSSAYWLGLALNSDGNSVSGYFWTWDWLKLITITTVSALALSVMFELVADIGAPMASGLKKEKRKGTPEFLLIVTALAIVMSAASKWGYYEDRRQARATEAAQIAAEDETAAARLAEAQATIKRLEGTDDKSVSQTALASLTTRIEDLKEQRSAAIAARDLIPAEQSTNRNNAQKAIDEQTLLIGELEEKKIAAQQAIIDADTLAAARQDEAKARDDLAADAGKLTEDKKEKVKIGDTFLIRFIRAALHQALCFLFPIIALDAWTAHRAVAKREEAARKAADTKRMKNPNYVHDADYSPSEPEVFTPPFGGYLGAKSEGETPDGAAPPDPQGFEGEEGDSDDNDRRD